jgi:hypothetical protein
MVRRGIVAGLRGNGIIRSGRVHDPSCNLLLYQSLPTHIPYRQAKVRRRKDDTGVGTTADTFHFPFLLCSHLQDGCFLAKDWNFSDVVRV